MFVLYVLMALGAMSIFSLAFPEADEKFCHTVYRLIMGGEDYD